MGGAVVKVKRLIADAVLPAYAHVDDAGMDLCSCEDVSIPPGEVRLVGTGLAIQLPPGTEAQIRPKSGLALKHRITILNTPGTIDEGYRGEVRVILINYSKATIQITKGTKVAQMVVNPVLRVKIEEVESLNNTERNEGGFGSTGV